MTLRKWFISPQSFEIAHQHRRIPVVTTERMDEGEIGLYVFTEEELRDFVKWLWLRGYHTGYDIGREGENLDVDVVGFFNKDWQQKMGGGNENLHKM